MGINLCSCNKKVGNISAPYTDLSVDNINYKAQQKVINSQIKHNKDSICLPNGNNINSFFENKDNHNNQNDIDHFNISLSPISNNRKNININIININNDSSNLKNNSSNKNMSNIITDKNYEYFKNKSNNEIVKEESSEKEESNSQENENESEKEDSKIEENKKELIEAFDQKIKEFADYISDDKLNEVENTLIKKLEDTLDDISIDSYDKSNCFSRPALQFKNDNSIYKGSWNAQGIKEGFGTFIDSKGNKYIGEWKNDKFNGKGRLFSTNGDYYEGYFIDGIIEGIGMFYSKVRGYKYLGEFKNNKFHGRGKLVYDDKMTYEGDFIEGYKDGKGKLVFSDGSYYEGNFVKNNFNGKGKFFFKDGRKYNGEWKNNSMDGKGVFNWGNECRYVGEYKNNKKEGNGVYYYGCNLFDGNWLNNMPHGEGTFLHDGIKIIGHFRFGKILEMIEGKGVNREITQKYTLDSKANCKSLDETNKLDDSKNVKTEKYPSDLGDKIEKIEKKNKRKESKMSTSKYNKHIKNNKSKEKDIDKEKDKKGKSKDKDKKRKKNESG